MDFDVVTKSLKGPLITTGSGLVTWARIFSRDGRLYVAESIKRGATVTSVTEYPMPEGEPDLNARRFGEWKWTQCGCAHSWRKHTVESLLAQAQPIDSPVLVDPAAGTEAPEGELSERLAWIAEPDDMEERKARASAVYDAVSQEGGDLDNLDAILDEAVYAPSQTEPEPVEA